MNKDLITSLIRHGFTSALGLLGLAVMGTWLASHGIISPEDAAAVDLAGLSIGASLVVVLTAIVGRYALALVGKVFTAGSGERDSSGGNSLGLFFACAIGVGTAAGIMGCLPSCSGPQIEAAKSIPIKACWVTSKGKVCYSSKSGLEVDVDQASGK